MSAVGWALETAVTMSRAHALLFNFLSTEPFPRALAPSVLSDDTRTPTSGTCYFGKQWFINFTIISHQNGLLILPQKVNRTKGNVLADILSSQVL